MNAGLLFEKPEAGTVLLKAGGVEQGLLNYNSNNQTVIFEKDGQYMTLTGLEGIDTIHMSGRKFVPAGEIIYEVLNPAPAGLYATYSNKPAPLQATTDHTGTSRKSGAQTSNTVSNVYLSRPYKESSSLEIIRHYWFKKGGIFYKANTEKQFLKAYPGKSAEIKNFIKESNLNLSKDSDLVKLIAFCNSLP